MWSHRISAVLVVVVSATLLRVSFVPAMDNLIQTHLASNNVSVAFK